MVVPAASIFAREGEPEDRSGARLHKNAGASIEGRARRHDIVDK